jgi:hypothetical protein
MNNSREQQIGKIKERIERGEYEVDPRAVADAIMDRLRLSTALAEEYQNECSKPDSSPSPSVNTTPPGPRTTWPIKVNRWLSNVAAAVGGIQTQSW